MEYGACDRLGAGTAADPYRPVVADYDCEFVAIEDGQGRYFVKFQGGDTAGAIADIRVVTLNRPLTDVLTALQANVVNNRLEARYGITSDPVVAGMTVLQAYDAIIAAIDPTASWDTMKLYGNTQ